MFLKSSLLLAILALLTQTELANAATLDIKGSFDLSGITSGKFKDTLQSYAVGDGLLFPVSQKISVGDTVNVDISFLAGQSLTMGSTGGSQEFNGWLWQDSLLEPVNTSYFTIHSNSGMSFYDGVNNVFSLGSNSSSSGASHIGLNYNGNFLVAGQAITFDHFRYSFVVDGLTTNGTNPIDSNHYSEPYMRFVADQVTLNISAVPEPENLTLLALGLFALGLRLRGRQGSVA